MRVVLLKFLSGGYQRIPGDVSCRCPGGSLETPPRWHATIYYWLISFFLLIFRYSLNQLKHSEWCRTEDTRLFIGCSHLAQQLTKVAPSETEMEEKAALDIWKRGSVSKWGSITSCDVISCHITFNEHFKRARTLPIQCKKHLENLYNFIKKWKMLC